MLQLGQAALLVGDQPAAGLGRAMQVITGTLAELGNLVIGEPNRDPLAGNGLFDLGNSEIWQVARRAPGVAELYRNHFGAVVVDEFQDLTPQQLRLVNRIGYGNTTFAGDLAQGIYSFAGADPEQIDLAVRKECTEVVEFAESHRSSPAVLAMVNALSGLTGGLTLTSARPESRPGGGVAGGIAFADPVAEGRWAVEFARYILARAPEQRIGIICRTASRREAVDSIAERSELPYYRWDDGVLDTETARLLKVMLVRLNAQDVVTAPDPTQYLREVVEFDAVADVDTRRSLRRLCRGASTSWERD